MAEVDTQKYVLEFKDIIYDVKNMRKNDEKKFLRLINGFNGRFESGKLTAIMGPSGSCKTSFLNLLIGNNQKDSLTYGKVLYCGNERNLNTWRNEYAILEQDDIIIPQMTVFNFIKFYVQCKCLNKSEKELNYLINDMMEELGILQIKNMILENVSGGERKRVMLTIELILETNVLILDEPTSGLDSHLALKLMLLLRKYAVNKNKIVIMTLHQPGSGLFNLIDNLFFVYKGMIMYDGLISDLEKWFKDNKLFISNKLSIAEFLFEIFTRNSVFSEVNKYEPHIKKMIEEKKVELDKKYIKIKTKAGVKDNTIDYKVNFKHVKLLIKRALGLLFSNHKLSFFFKIFPLCFLFIFLFLFLTSIFNFYSKSFYLNMRSLDSNLNENNEFIVNKIMKTTLVEKFKLTDPTVKKTRYLVISYFKSMFENITWGFFGDIPKDFYGILISPNIFCVSFYCCAIFEFDYITTFPDFTLASFEISKYYYSYTSYYFGKLLCEIIFDLWKYIFFCIFSFYSGFNIFINIFQFFKFSFLFLFYLISLKVFFTFIFFVLPGKFLNILFSAIYFFLLKEAFSLNNQFILYFLPIPIEFLQNILKQFIFILHMLVPVTNLFAFLHTKVYIDILNYLLDYCKNIKLETPNTILKFKYMFNTFLLMNKPFFNSTIMELFIKTFEDNSTLLLNKNNYFFLMFNKISKNITKIESIYNSKFIHLEISSIFNLIFSFLSFFTLIVFTLFILKIKLTRKQKLNLSD